MYILCPPTVNILNSLKENEIIIDYLFLYLLNLNYQGFLFASPSESGVRAAGRGPGTARPPPTRPPSSPPTPPPRPPRLAWCSGLGAPPQVGRHVIGCLFGAVLAIVCEFCFICASIFSLFVYHFQFICASVFSLFVYNFQFICVSISVYFCINF